ncbi:MAG: hypothetical protein AB1758_27915 [Candidatus Eremiobacterota bacterium]
MTIGQKLASDAQRRLSNVYSTRERFSIRDHCLDQVANETADPVERAVAEAARHATWNHVRAPHRDRSNLDVETTIDGMRIAMQALARGVGGPVGVVLASLGRQVVQSAEARCEGLRRGDFRNAATGSYPDGANMGAAYLQAIQRSASPAESAVVSLALKESQQAEPDMLASHYQLAAFQVVEEGAGSSPGKALARFAQLACGPIQGDLGFEKTCRYEMPAPEATRLRERVLRQILENGDSGQQEQARRALSGGLPAHDALEYVLTH